MPSRQASCSRSLKGNVQEFTRRLLVFEALGQHPQGEGLDLRHCLWPICPITEHSGEVRNLGDPPAVLFTFELNLEDHNGTLAPGPPLSKIG